MRTFHSVVVAAHLMLLSNVNSAMLPVTGDSTAVWSAIDLLPTGNIPSETAASTPAPSTTETKTTPASPAKTSPAAVNTPAAEASVKIDAPRSAAREENRSSVVSTRQQSTPAEPVPVPADTAIIPGTIIITSIPDNATITINEVTVGTTPYNVSGFYPGGYDITLQKDGFAVYRKTIEITPGSTEFVTGNLVTESGYLHVISTPANATVSINDTIVGMTPFTSKPLQPGIYRLTIDHPGHISYSEQLGVTPNLTDTLQVSLLKAEKPGILNNDTFKSSRNVRRVTFAVTGIAATAAGILLNSKVAHNLKLEQDALDRYYEAMLSESEYTSRYSAYRDITRSTDRYALLRNICYGIGIASGVCFTVSIPF